MVRWKACREFSKSGKFNLPATFFIPGATCDHHTEVAKAIVEAGHEIGHHGYYHELPSQLDELQEREMIERGLDAVQRLTGKTPRGYRSPSWELSDQTFSSSRNTASSTMRANWRGIVHIG